MSAKQVHAKKILAAAVFATIGSASVAQATLYVYDTNGATVATIANGFWDTTTPNWSTGLVNVDSVLWPNHSQATDSTDADDAQVPSQTSLVVTVAANTNINVHNLTLKGSSQTIASAGSGATQGTLTFSGTTPTISWQNGNQTFSAKVIGNAQITMLDTSSGTVTISNGGSTFSGGAILTGSPVDPVGKVYSLNASTTGAPGAVTSGPLGTGTVAFNGVGIATNQATLTLDNALTFTGSNDFTYASAANRNYNFGGNVTLTGNTTINMKISPGIMNFSGAIGESGGVRRFTLGDNNNLSGTIEFSGTTANTYTGLTGVNGATLLLSKTAGVTAIAGDIQFITTQLTGVGNPTLMLGADDQIANTSTMSWGLVSVATLFDLNGHNETIKAIRGANNESPANALNEIVTNNGASGTTSVLTLAPTGNGGGFYGQIKDGASGGKVSLVVNAAATGGIQFLSNVNTYTGDTIIKGGTLALTSTNGNITGGNPLPSGSIANSASITVGDSLTPTFAAKFDVSSLSAANGGSPTYVLGASQTLQGFGTIATDSDTSVQINGTIGAGTSGTIGTLTVNAASQGSGVSEVAENSHLVLTSGAVVKYKVGGTTAAPTSDLINVTATGTAAIGTSTLTLDGAGSYTLNISDLSGGAFNPVDGTYTTLVLVNYSGANPASTGNWTVNLPSAWVAENVIATVQFGAHDLEVAVPEPTSLGLLGFGALGLLSRRRRRAMVS